MCIFIITAEHCVFVDRDAVRSKVIPEELDKRRTLLWDIVGLDARLVSIPNRQFCAPVDA